MSSISRRVATVVLAAAGLWAASGMAYGGPYVFTDLGTFGGSFSRGFGINNAGQVVGTSSIRGDASFHATLWNGADAVDLGTFGAINSYAQAINDAGQVVGYRTSPGNIHATLWQGGTAIDLGVPGTLTWAMSINNAGQAAGGMDSHAARWNGTTPIDLGVLGGTSSFGYAINSGGQVAGASHSSDGFTLRAALWNGTTPIDLGTLGGDNSFAYGINDAAQVVGYSYPVGNISNHATLWNGTTAVDLWPDGFAYDINNTGQAVGERFLFESNAFHAFLWNGTAATDLNSLVDAGALVEGWYLKDATAINDRGWMTGTAFNSVTGETHAYLLAVVPEPHTHALLLAGLGLLAEVALRGAAAPPV